MLALTAVLISKPAVQSLIKNITPSESERQSRGVRVKMDIFGFLFSPESPLSGSLWGEGLLNYTYVKSGA